MLIGIDWGGTKIEGVAMERDGRELLRLREAMPRAVFLIPGVGAQGGKVEDLGAAFSAGRASALITVSRALVNAWEQTGGDPSESAKAAADQLRAAIWNVSG